MASPIVWLASYPRSGNTWLRVMLYAYLHGPPESSSSVAAAFPDLHVDNEFDPARPGRQIVKTHFPFSPAHPHADRTSGAIIVMRHPRDVLLSCLDFHSVLGTKTNQGSLEGRQYAEMFIRSMGDPVWISMGFGTWPRFHETWLGDLPSPRLAMKYEDMRADPARHLAMALEFLGEPRDEARISRAIAEASFDRMRALEVREKAGATTRNTFFGGGPSTFRKRHLFMKKARLGESLDAIRPGLDTEFAERFGAIIGTYGYT